MWLAAGGRVGQEVGKLRFLFQLFLFIISLIIQIQIRARLCHSDWTLRSFCSICASQVTRESPRSTQTCYLRIKRSRRAPRDRFRRLECREAQPHQTLKGCLRCWSVWWANLAWILLRLAKPSLGDTSSLLLFKSFLRSHQRLCTAFLSTQAICHLDGSYQLLACARQTKEVDGWSIPQRQVFAELRGSQQFPAPQLLILWQDLHRSLRADELAPHNLREQHEHGALNSVCLFSYLALNSARILNRCLDFAAFQKFY